MGERETERAMEVRLRRHSSVRGLKLIKSRARLLNADNQGQYQLLDTRTNRVIAGARFDEALDRLAEIIYAAPILPKP